MDNFQNLVKTCYTCGVSDTPIVSLKVRHSHQICELLRKSDIFLQNSQIPTWNNCDHCLNLISELDFLLSKQAKIVEQIKTKIAKEAKNKTENLSDETPEIKEEEEVEDESETEFEPAQFFCKIEVDPDPDEPKNDEEDDDPLSLQTFDPAPTEQATSLEKSKRVEDKDQASFTIQTFDPPSPPSLENSKRDGKDGESVQTFNPPPPKRAKIFTGIEKSKRDKLPTQTFDLPPPKWAKSLEESKSDEDKFTLRIVDPATSTRATSFEESESDNEEKFSLLIFDPVTGTFIKQAKGPEESKGPIKPKPPRKPTPSCFQQISCPTCNKLFRGGSAKSRLHTHIEHVHEKVKSFTCPYCTDGFASKKSWLRHLLQKHETSSPQKSFSCPTCKNPPKLFAISELYDRHVQNHTKFDTKCPFFCPICDDRFQRQDQLDSHTAKSCPLPETPKKSKRTYPCSLCPSVKFQQPVKLAIHQRSLHPKELLTFTCATCGSLHLAKSHLATHSLLHANKDSYACLVCNRAIFNAKDDLSLHLATIHTGEETVPCGVSDCPALFSSLAGKLQHLGSVHNLAVFECPSCDEKFVTFSAKVNHVARAHKDAGVESFPCEWAGCGKKYETRASLRAHVGLVHQQRRQKTCEICGKTLLHSASYRNHVKIHGGVKDFICEVCGRGFICENNLRSHRASSHE